MQRWGRLEASIWLLRASWPTLGISPQCPPMARRTSPGCPRWLSPRSPPSPWPAANTRVRSRGAWLVVKRCSRASSSSSGVPMPTKPEVATTSPSRTRAAASAAETILLRMSCLRMLVLYCFVWFQQAGPGPRPGAGAAGPLCWLPMASVEAGQVVGGDDHAHGRRLDHGDREDVLVRGLVREAGDGQQGDHRAVVWQRVHATAGHG